MEVSTILDFHTTRKRPFNFLTYPHIPSDNPLCQCPFFEHFQCVLTILCTPLLVPVDLDTAPLSYQILKTSNSTQKNVALKSHHLGGVVCTPAFFSHSQ